MSKLRLTLACWDYDRTRPLIDGRVRRGRARDDVAAKGDADAHVDVGRPALAVADRAGCQIDIDTDRRSIKAQCVLSAQAINGVIAQAARQLVQAKAALHRVGAIAAKQRVRAV